MLNSATDYEYLDVSDLSSFITGDIFPKRMAREDGSDRQIKYEDYLFALEAQKERYGWNSNPPSTLITPAGRVEALNAIIRNNSTIGEYNNASYNTYHFIDRYYTIPTSVIPVSFDSSDYSHYVQKTLGIQNPSFESIPSIYIKSLLKEIICKQYWNIKQCNRTIYEILHMSDLATYTETITRLQEDEDPITSYQSGDFNGQIYSTGYATRVGSMNRRYILSSKQPLITDIPYAKTATLILIGNGRIYPKATHVEQINYCAIPLSCNISNGTIYTPTLDVNSLATSISSITGVVYNQSPYYEEYCDYSMGINAAAVIIDHEFPAEIDSITGWDWEPETTP